MKSYAIYACCGYSPRYIHDALQIEDFPSVDDDEDDDDDDDDFLDDEDDDDDDDE